MELNNVAGNDSADSDSARLLLKRQGESWYGDVSAGYCVAQANVWGNVPFLGSLAGSDFTPFWAHLIECNTQWLLDLLNVQLLK